jgi:hypothetical protein
VVDLSVCHVLTVLVSVCTGSAYGWCWRVASGRRNSHMQRPFTLELRIEPSMKWKR